MAPSFFNILYVVFCVILFSKMSSSSWKVKVLLAASLIFYFLAEPAFLVLLILFAILSYVTGHYLYKYKEKKKIIINVFFLSLLTLYLPLKFNNTFHLIFNDYLGLNYLRWLYLPLGFSFHTFQVMSYVFDIYYEKYIPEKRFGNYLLYISYFPQITCGPIGRADHFLPQLENLKVVDDKNIYKSAGLIILGIFKKLVFANSLYFIISGSYQQTQKPSGLEWIYLGFLTRFFVYYDFAGYTDISRGISSIFGIELIQNFNHPFKSTSMADFWRRWHISLSNWIRDYIYYPLVSKSSNRLGIYACLVISFVFLGIWHGDKWNFIIYGLINGLAVAITSYNQFKNKNKAEKSLMRKIISQFNLFVFLICLPSVLLLTNSNKDILTIARNLLTPKNWLEIRFFANSDILFVLYYIIPLVVIFELISMNFEMKIKNIFYNMHEFKKIIILLFVIGTIFLLSTPSSRGFFYQDF